jgi:hypothetical protein
LISSLLSAAIAGVAGVLAWLATNWVGKPISDARHARIKALQVAEDNAHVGSAAGEARITEARAALRDAVSTLRSIARGQPWPVPLYSRFFRYDLETAASALIELHNMAGEPYGDERRHLVRDAVYVVLGAHKHLSAERINEIRAQLERDKRPEAVDSETSGGSST